MQYKMSFGVFFEELMSQEFSGMISQVICSFLGKSYLA